MTGMEGLGPKRGIQPVDAIPDRNPDAGTRDPKSTFKRQLEGDEARQDASRQAQSPGSSVAPTTKPATSKLSVAARMDKLQEVLEQIKVPKTP